MVEKRTKIILLIAVFAVTLFFLLERSFLPGLSSDSPPPKDLKLVEKVISLLRDHYFEEPQPFETMEGAFKGLANSLDPVSCYLDKENFLKYQSQKEARLKETGIILYKEKYGYYPQVLAIIANSPAQTVDIKLGDLISSIDHKSTLPMSMLEANLNLKNRKEKNANLEIIRRNETQMLAIERKMLFKEPVSFSAQEETSGILRIHHLYSPCVDKIKEDIIPQLKDQKKPLLLDLRNCYEGELEEAVKLSNLFLEAKEVGYLGQREKAKKIFSLLEKPVLEKTPLIIWVNQATIGPAEALAAILAEFHKSKILGFPTLGLAAQQSLFTLNDGSALILNSGIFTLKSGKRIWKKGIEPDVVLKSKDQSDDSYLKETMKIIPKM